MPKPFASSDLQHKEFQLFLGEYFLSALNLARFSSLEINQHTTKLDEKSRKTGAPWMPTDPSSAEMSTAAMHHGFLLTALCLLACVAARLRAQFATRSWASLSSGG
jgi:hypothetical protein